MLILNIIDLDGGWNGWVPQLIPTLPLNRAIQYEIKNRNISTTNHIVMMGRLVLFFDNFLILFTVQGEDRKEGE